MLAIVILSILIIALVYIVYIENYDMEYKSDEELYSIMTDIDSTEDEIEEATKEFNKRLHK